MAWIRLDDQIAHHPKFNQVGPVASWLWVCCLGYAQKFLTDGFIPAASVRMVGTVTNTASHVRKLVAANLLEVVDGGYQIHDYLEYNASAAEVRSDREWDRLRKTLYADRDLVRRIKQRDSDHCRYCDAIVNWTDKRSKLGAQFDHVIPRGDTSFENLVVACRGCNIRKGKRLLAACGMTLLVPFSQRTKSEPVPNQLKTDSDLPRARASYPSHPIPSDQKKEDLDLEGGGNSRAIAAITVTVAPKNGAALPFLKTADARSKRPIFTGQRLTVFEWMFDDCTKVLGPLTEAFDLHAWFYELDALAATASMVIPKRDGGAWLHSQLLSEATRRGLPIAIAETTKKPSLAARMAAVVERAKREES